MSKVLLRMAEALADKPKLPSEGPIQHHQDVVIYLCHRVVLVRAAHPLPHPEKAALVESSLDLDRRLRRGNQRSGPPKL